MQAVEELDWRPEYGLVEGLKDSWDKDFNRGTYRKEADFSTGERCSHPWGQNPLQDPLPARYRSLHHNACEPSLGCQPWQGSCHCMSTATCEVGCMLACWGASWDWW